MGATLQYAAAVPLAVTAAACFGAAGLMEHQAARQAPDRGPLHPQLLRDLLRQPLFRWGLVCSVVAFCLQVAALSLAPLAVVQPLLVTGVLFYLGFAAVFLAHRVDRVLVAGAVLTLAGLIAFLLAADPEPGNARFQGNAALPLGIALSAVVAACLLISSRLRGELQAIPTAAATAVCYGVTAGLLRSLLVLDDPGSLFGQWQLYAVIIVAPAGFLLNQNAFQEGVVGSVAVAVITVGDPIVAIGVGAAWLDESLSGGPLRTTMEVVALIVMAAGIYVLATRAQRVAQRIQRGIRAQLPEAAHEVD